MHVELTATLDSIVELSWLGFVGPQPANGALVKEVCYLESVHGSSGGGVDEE